MPLQQTHSRAAALVPLRKQRLREPKVGKQRLVLCQQAAVRTPLDPTKTKNNNNNTIQQHHSGTGQFVPSDPTESPPAFPLRNHAESQENDGQTGTMLTIRMHVANTMGQFGVVGGGA